jgi:hypothetical protein
MQSITILGSKPPPRPLSIFPGLQCGSTPFSSETHGDVLVSECEGDFHKSCLPNLLLPIGQTF